MPSVMIEMNATNQGLRTFPTGPHPELAAGGGGGAGVESVMGRPLLGN